MSQAINKKKEGISVCALTLYPFDMVPGQRYRIEQWEPFLNKQGISIDYFPFADVKLTQILPKPGNFPLKVSKIIKGFAERFLNLTKLSSYDVIYIYRAAAMIGPAFPERMIKLSGRPVIFDFDDAIFLPHTNEANKLFSWMKFAGKTRSICRISNSVMVGNSWLAEYARRYNSNVTVIPSSVNTEVYSPNPKSENANRKVIIGWTGSSTSQTHLEIFAPTLRKIINRFPVEIHVHSDRSPDLPDIPFTWHKWSPENEIEVISGFDIGIMPLPNDDWSLGKCSMKALLYMSFGIPTVCSDVGMNREVINHGENGFLASEEEEWFKSLKMLIDSVDLRSKIGVAARKTVTEKYSMEKCADLFSDVIRNTIDKAQRRKV